MRRRLLDCGRLKRPPTKRTRPPETAQTYTYTYWKLLALWLTILGLDTMGDIRFEFVYPVYMFARSVYDSYRYQGMVFAMLFMYLVVYCDLMWLSLLSGPLLFVVASSCVWLEIVRNVEHISIWWAVSLWLMFLYVEFAHRFHSLPQHLLNVSRPFAAHCIGYPVVTLSFLLKHNITHIIRQRQRKRVIEENSVYFSILQKSLPQEEIVDDQNAGGEEAPIPLSNHTDKPNKSSPKAAGTTTVPKQGTKSQNSTSGKHRSSSNGRNETKQLSNHKTVENGTGSSGQVVANGEAVRPMSAGKVHLPSGKKQATVKAVPREDQPLVPPTQAKNTVEILQTDLKHEKQARADAELTISKLEMDIKKLRADLHASCLQEEETTARVDQLQIAEKHHRNELTRLKAESETLQNKMGRLSSSKHNDQSSIAELEKRLKVESGERVRVETELRDYKQATQNSWSEEEVRELQGRLAAKDKEIDALKKELKKSDKMLEGVRKDLNAKQDIIQANEKEKKSLKASLSDETRVKIDLFTSLSEGSRKNQSLMEESQRKSIEINRLKQRLAEVMAIIPSSVVTTVAGRAPGYPPSPPASSPH